MSRFSEKVYKAARNAEVVGVPHSEAEFRRHLEPLFQSKDRLRECEGQFLRLLLSLGTGALVAQHIFPLGELSGMSGALTKAGLLCNLLGIVCSALALYRETYDRRFEYDVRRLRVKEWRDPNAGIGWMPPFHLRHSATVAYAAFLLEAAVLTLGIVAR